MTHTPGPFKSGEWYRALDRMPIHDECDRLRAINADMLAALRDMKKLFDGMGGEGRRDKLKASLNKR